MSTPICEMPGCSYAAVQRCTQCQGMLCLQHSTQPAGVGYAACIGYGEYQHVRQENMPGAGRELANGCGATLVRAGCGAFGCSTLGLGLGLAGILLTLAVRRAR